MKIQITFFVFPLTLFVTLICLIEFTSAQSAAPVLKRVNVAHRGASYLAPENTLTAYRIAISAGADGAECDVYKTADDILVLSHDKSTKRTMGGKNLDITKLKFNEIQKLDAGNWKGKQFKNEKVPTLDEYLEILKNTKCSPIVEIKMEQIEKLVLESIKKQNMIKDTVIIAFSENVIKEIRRLEPNICVAWLYNENPNSKETPDENTNRLADFLLKKCKELDINILDLGHTMLSQKLIKKLKESGIHVWCWTVNDPKRMKILLDWGVESITTDRPELLHEILKEKSVINQ
ncbi:MAG: hypothetical protein LBE18_04165 [Planctomycetaceae bacterium]|jgi:glycerophosphoryl diester phosphodiesterase|nr:hypothetical protein [Planctomycetaceae bacterium]